MPQAATGKLQSARLGALHLQQLSIAADNSQP